MSCLLFWLLTCMGIPQGDDAGLAARWGLDGDVRDRGATAVPTKASGRLEFIDSPVGAPGKMAVFNGVDVFISADPAAGLGAGAGDFTLSAWIFSLERKAATLFARKGWSLTILENGGLKLATEAGTLESPAGSHPAAQWNHVLISVKRGTEGALSRIFVNGVSVASGNVRAMDLDPPQVPLLMGKGLDEGRLFTGFMKDVRLYSRALEEAEAVGLTDQGLPWIRPKPSTKSPFPGKFDLLQDDVVTFAGGEDARVGLDHAYLETLLSLNFPSRRIHYRNMAWEGDTVFDQYRPLNFGSWTDQFRRTGTTVIFAQFGQVESLEGRAGVERFSAAYEALLSQFAQATKRIVLVSPTPFGRGRFRQPELLTHNDDLRLYVDAIRKIAGKNGFLFIDLTTKPLTEEGLTRDGLHLTREGHWISAQETARQLEIAGVSDLEAPDLKGEFRRESYEKIRSAIRFKNVLWNESWRPTNWAFLNGDRIEQPSSRDHQDRRVRWFPVEVQQLPAMLRREEGKIEALLQEKK